MPEAGNLHSVKAPKLLQRTAADRLVTKERSPGAALNAPKAGQAAAGREKGVGISRAQTRPAPTVKHIPANGKS